MAVLVLYRLGARSLWLDEGFTYAAASQHGTRLLSAALKDGGTSLSYYIGLHFWLEAAGSRQVALRLPTAIAGIGTAAVCFYTLRRLFDRRAAIFGSTFVAVSVGFVWWAQNARAYVLAAFLVCCSMMAFVCGVQGGRRRAWVAYVLLTALAAYTLVLSVLIVIAQVASLPALGPWKSWPRRQMAASFAALAILGLPLLWVFADHGTGPASWITPPVPLFGVNNRYLFEFLASTRSVGVPYKQTTVTLLTTATVLTWALAAAEFTYRLATRGRGQASWSYALLLIWFTLPPVLSYVISMQVHPILSDRYIIDALPAGSMVAGVGLSRLRPRPVAAVAAVAMVCWRASMIPPGYGYSIEDWRQGVTDVTARAHPRDCIAFFVADGYSSFDYYVEHSAHLPGPVPRPVLPASPWSSKAAYALDPESIREAQLAGLVASCPRIWLLQSHASGVPPGPGVPEYRARVYEASQRLHAELTGAYVQQSAWSFRGAHVFLYVRDGHR
jgi:4-amino-4-deoxy-L-arabinose transferase-like glycosyltransferase